MKPGRNDPCPCGSGKKYKKCCLITERDLKSAERNLIRKIREFTDDARFDEEINEAFALFWSDIEPEPEEVVWFIDWFTHDYELRSGFTPIELFYHEKAEELSAGEREILKEWLDTCLSVYEVQEIEGGVGIRVKDLFLGGEYFVHDVNASKAVSKWDIMVARIHRVKGKNRFSGAGKIYGQNMKNRLLEYLKEEWRAYRSEFPDASKKEFLKERGLIFNFFTQMLEEEALQGIRLTTVEGDEMIFCEAVFDVADFERAAEGLRGHEDFHREEDSEEIRYAWAEAGESANFTAARARLNRAPPPMKSVGTRILGRITLTMDELVLECTSKERLAAGKKLLIQRLGDAIRHKFDTSQEVDEALDSIEARGEKEELPQEVVDSAMREYLEAYYAEWINMPIPALDGLTPLEASRTPGGRRKLEELLKGLENMEERKKKVSGYGYDVEKIRKALNM
jgi:hypothetical protein